MLKESCDHDRRLEEDYRDQCNHVQDKICKKYPYHHNCSRDDPWNYEEHDKRSNESQNHRRKLKNDSDHETMSTMDHDRYSRACVRNEPHNEEGHWRRLK